MIGKCESCKQVTEDVKVCAVRIGDRNTRCQLCGVCRQPLEEFTERMKGKSRGRRRGPRPVIPIDEIPVRRKR